jgi:hypothetical protein
VTGRRVVFFDAYSHVFTGAQRATLLIMEGLAGRGWSVEMAVPADGPLAEHVRDAGLAVTGVTTAGEAVPVLRGGAWQL